MNMERPIKNAGTVSWFRECVNRSRNEIITDVKTVTPALAEVLLASFALGKVCSVVTVLMPHASAYLALKEGKGWHAWKRSLEDGTHIASVAR